MRGNLLGRSLGDMGQERANARFRSSVFSPLQLLDVTVMKIGQIGWTNKGYESEKRRLVSDRLQGKNDCTQSPRR